MDIANIIHLCKNLDIAINMLACTLSSFGGASLKTWTQSWIKETSIATDGTIIPCIVALGIKDTYVAI